MRRSGFTMIEMLAAILILSVMTIVTGVTFNSVINSWKKATTVAERMQTADYALNQIVAGLRSAYYPTDGNQKDEWGFMLLDGGDGEDVSESDVIEWTKLGNSIIGDKSTMGETSHRVRMWVEESREKDEPGGLWVRVWNPDLFVEDDEDRFDEDEFGEEFLLVEDVVGFDCQVQKDVKEVDSDGKPKWEDTWDTSNSIPYRVKITFRMKPPEQGDDPLPILRVVEIPVSELSQNPFSLDGSTKGNGKKNSNDSGDGGKTGGTGGKNGGNGGKAGGNGNGGKAGGTGGMNGGGARGGAGGGMMPGGGGGMPAGGGAPL